MHATTIACSILSVFVCMNAINAKGTVQPQLAKEQVVKFGNGTEPKGLDPTITTGVAEAHIVDNLFEGLTTIDPFNQESQPGMASEWNISSDGLVYTFTIRKNAQWSDGTKLNAHDFVWSWTRALAPMTASEYAYQLHYIKNGRAFNEGKLKDPKLLGVVAKDDHTLVVTLEHPTAFFLQLTAFHTLFPTPRHVIEKHDSRWTSAKTIVSNGPFKLTEWRLNQHIKLVKNESYWDAKRVTLKEAYIYAIENADTEERTFMAGDLHFTSTVPPMKIPSYKSAQKRHPAKYHPYKVNPYLGSYYFRFNTKKKPTDDARVRRALALTIDRYLIVTRITKGGQKPATAFTPPIGKYNFPKTLPISVGKKEVAEAKKLLAQAGYPNGKGMPTIEILYNTSEAHENIAVAVQQMWKKHLGVKVRLFNQEWKVYLDTMRSGNYSVARAGWIGDYPDPNTFLDLWVTNGGNNQTGWSNTDYDRLINQAGQTTDQSARFKYFSEAETILLEEMPVLPIYIYTNTKLVSQKLKMIKDDGTITDWTSNTSDRISLKHYALAQ